MRQTDHGEEQSLVSIMKLTTLAVMLACLLPIVSQSAEARVCVTVAGDAACLDSQDASPLGKRVPLIVVHGWNPDGVPAPPLDDTWSNFADFFGQDSALMATFKRYAFSYYSNAVTLVDIGRAFRDILDQMDNDDPTGFGSKPVVIVAHSMGGLISRHVLPLQQLSGLNAGHPAGNRVLRLITLGTPHHGSVLANGPAMEDKAGTGWGLALRDFNDLFYGCQGCGPAWYQPNRTDLFWDNYDGLLDYDRFGSERSVFLTALNSTTTYDNKITAYAGSIAPSFLLIDPRCDKYCKGSTVIGGVFGLGSDGVVPVSSALLHDTQGSSRFTTRYFPDYDHSQLAAGKGDGVLFKQLKADLLASVPSALPRECSFRAVAC